MDNFLVTVLKNRWHSGYGSQVSEVEYRHRWAAELLHLGIEEAMSTLPADYPVQAPLEF